MYLALFYVIILSIYRLFEPLSFDKDFFFVDWTGIPAYFGISLFAFEGNPIALEIY